MDGAGRAGHDRAVLSMVIQLAAMFGLQVVAQGIEREDQRDALAALGCELGQGYLLGRPLPLPALSVALPIDCFVSAFSIPCGDVIASAQAAVDCLAVGPEDDVLVLCNDPQLMIADALGEAAGVRAPATSGCWRSRPASDTARSRLRRRDHGDGSRRP